MIIGARQTRATAGGAAPAGSLDDHAYVLNDAGVTSLIIDPNLMFVERALGLLDKVPGLQQVLTIGPVPGAGLPPTGGIVDLTAAAGSYPAAGRPPTCRPTTWAGCRTPEAPR